MSDQIKSILDEYARGILKLLGNHLKQVILYGSYVRNEQSQSHETSDIDIMILVDLPESKIKLIEKKITDYSYEIDLKYNVLLKPLPNPLNSTIFVSESLFSDWP